MIRASLFACCFVSLIGLNGSLARAGGDNLVLPRTVLDVAIGPVADPIYLLAPTANQAVGQSFTVLVSGILDRVELQVARDGNVTAPLRVDVLPVGANGRPMFESTPLATTSIDASAFPAFSFNPSSAYIPVSFANAGLAIHYGERLAVRLTTTQPYAFPSSDAYIWNSSQQAAGLYAGGDAWYFNTTTGAWDMGVPYDYLMKTYVTVPEPVSLVTLAGVAGVTLRRRRTR